MQNFDVIIIGGGPGGYKAAELLSEGGKSVLLFEKRRIGGVCLNEGCVPSKAFLNSAKALDYCLHSESYGVISTNGATIDQQKVVERKNRVVNTLVEGIEKMLKKNKVEILYENAYIEKKEGELFTVSSESGTYHSNALILATGSSPTIPKIEGLSNGLLLGDILTNREILDLTEIPKRLAIVGGGVIGLEMASYFGRAGSEVTVVEMLPNIGGDLDPFVGRMLTRALQEQNITFKMGCQVTNFEEGKLFMQEKGELKELSFDKCLISIGRRANVEGIGLENVDVELEKGKIQTSDTLQTSEKNLFAIGDVNGKVMLAHTAYREAEVVANNIFGNSYAIEYDSIPSVIYTSPEVAKAGFSDKHAKELGMEVDSVNLSMGNSGRFLAECDKVQGTLKLVRDKLTNTIVGGVAMGAYASEFIVVISSFISSKKSIEELKKIVFPHPTVGELIHEALFKFH